jgi:Ca-activated chloride channel family protein
VSAKLASALLLAGSLGVGLPFPLSLLKSAPHLPAKIERWLYNPRERIHTAIVDARGDKASRERAPAEADTALRLAPGDPRIQYDAGTVHLGAGDARGAAEILEKAAHAAGPDLAGATAYNLGNARLGEDEPEGAVAAYEQALRLDPANPNAKWNLELALRQRERKRQMKGPSSQGGGKGGGNASQSPGNDQKSEQQKGSGTPDPGKSQQQQSGGANDRPGGQGQPQPRPGDQPLPQWKNQPDMTASEAAALLESVENLERQQRRAQAAQRAQRRSARGKDW